MTHPVQALDEMVHQRSRLGILAVLAEGGRVQFAFLQESLDLSDGNLSRHLSTLENAGYVRIEKGYEGRRPRTWAHITKTGRDALAHEVAQLKALVARLETSPQRTAAGNKRSPTPFQPDSRINDALAGSPPAFR